MNPVSAALDKIIRRNSREILERVFIRRKENWRQIPYDLKEMINQEVLRPIVLPDCDIVGGTEITIPLDDLRAEETDNGYTKVFRIPKNRTNNRTITSVLDVTYASLYQNLGGYGSNAISRASPAMQLGAAVMEAQLRVPYTSTAKVQLIGENVVMVKDSILLPVNLYLRCVLGNEENLSNIQTRSYLTFQRLVEYAVHAYIYSQYRIEMDHGELAAGITLNSFKETIMEWSDAQKNYDDWLEGEWRRTAFMNDTESFGRFIGLLVGGTR